MKRIALALCIAVVVCNDMYGMNKIPDQDYQVSKNPTKMSSIQTDDFKIRKIRRPFTPDEDKVIITGVNLGMNNRNGWPLIAAKLSGRTGKQVKDRWVRCLDPKINRDPWTPEENLILVEALKQHGQKWIEIAKIYFPNRTDQYLKNICRNQYKSGRFINQLPQSEDTSNLEGQEELDIVKALNMFQPEKEESDSVLFTPSTDFLFWDF